ILIEKADPSTLEVGDIIVFISDDPSIKGSRNTHRIVEIIGDHEEFVTKGDHNVIADQVNARAENVVGKVVRTLPVLTRFSRLLTAPTGLVMMIAFILVILMVMYLPDMKKATEDTEKEVKAEHDKMIDEMVAKQVEYLKSLDAKKPADTEEKTE
ncbi:MAG: signal peptidase I, partial [Lachnospiraceae bacterium]|nr:signal peptidase I [Lachnospiraceae bacterium]